jgi:hypothetical protein
MKRFALFLLALCAGVSVLRADEGMWLPSEIYKNIKDMQAKGFKLTAEDIYSINNSSLKDAVVHFAVDRTAPVVTISGMTPDGRYQTDSQTVVLIPTDDGGALKSLIVNMVDKNGNVIREVINLSGKALIEELEKNEGRITFQIGEGLYQNIQVLCTDYASADTSDATNAFNSTIENVSVSTSAFMIFWANKKLRWGTIGGAATVLSAGIFLIFKKKKKDETAPQT